MIYLFVQLTKITLDVSTSLTWLYRNGEILRFHPTLEQYVFNCTQRNTITSCDNWNA